MTKLMMLSGLLLYGMLVLSAKATLAEDTPTHAAPVPEAAKVDAPAPPQAVTTVDSSASTPVKVDVPTSTPATPTAAKTVDSATSIPVKVDAPTSPPATPTTVDSSASTPVKVDVPTPPPATPTTVTTMDSSTPTDLAHVVETLPTQQEKTILATILKAFKDGHVNLQTLASALNDPNLNKLAAALNRANLKNLASALEQPQDGLAKLTAALSDPELNLDKVLAVLGAEETGGSSSFNSDGIVKVMKDLAGRVSSGFNKGLSSLTSHGSTNGTAEASKDDIEKQEAELERKLHEADDKDQRISFERSAPKANAKTYGKILLEGMGQTGGGKGGAIDNATTKGEEQKSTLDHRMIYFAVAGVLILSLCIYIAARYAKSYRGGDSDGSSMRLSA